MEDAKTFIRLGNFRKVSTNKGHRCLSSNPRFVDYLLAIDIIISSNKR